MTFLHLDSQFDISTGLLIEVNKHGLFWQKCSSLIKLLLLLLKKKKKRKRVQETWL